MKNITVSVDEQTHRLARIRAAELDTSLSALVRGYLRGLADRSHTPLPEDARGGETVDQRRRRMFQDVLAEFDSRGVGLRMADNLPRDALYDRHAQRAEVAAAGGGGGDTSD